MLPKEMFRLTSLVVFISIDLPIFLGLLMLIAKWECCVQEPNPSSCSMDNMAIRDDQPGVVHYAVIDAFTDKPFRGNPAAVCLLKEDKDSEWMQGVANEFNLSQTAFLRKRLENTRFLQNDANANSPEEFDLRWFTPLKEVDLCGHATLAAAYLLFSSSYMKCNSLLFHTRSGILTANRITRSAEGKSGSAIEIPEKFAVQITLPQTSVLNSDYTPMQLLQTTLHGYTVQGCKKTSSNDYIIELESGELVEAIQPNFEEIRKCNARGIIITAPAPKHTGFDFSSRVFFGKFGVNEDPVCGSAHCALAPYWAMKLGKSSLVALQASVRSGKLLLHLDNNSNSVSLQGDAVTVMSGILTV